MRLVLPILSALALAGCAAAQMRLPDTLAGASRVEFAGIGGWRSGSYTAGAYAGRFERSSDRLSYFDTLTESRGHSAFTLAGADLPEPIEGRCRMRESSLDLGLVEVTTRPMAYRCEFRSGGLPLAASLELQEFNGAGAAMARYERRGRVALAGETVEIRSVHHLAGTSMPVLTPIGYVFEQHGRPVGAVELNGRPVLLVEPGASPELRRTLTLAASQFGENLILLREELVRDDTSDRMTDDLIGGIAKKARRSGVPGRDDAIERLADDCVV